MKHLLSVLLAAAGFCAQAQTTVVDSIKPDGVWRKFQVYVPANFGTGRPLILNLHGLGSNAVEQQFYSNFAPIADTAGFLMVYPQGLTSGGITYWNVGSPLTAGTDDVKFLSTLIDTLQRRYGTDPQRVYSTGMSLGGYMSYYLACNLSQKITAVASVAGTMFGNVAASCSPAHPTPVLQVHGTADSTVPYTGSSNGIPIDSLVALWVRKNNCNPTPAVLPLPDVNTTDSSTVTRYVYSGGSRSAAVEFFKVTNGDHTWPGAFNIGLKTNQDFSASAEIWRFFRNYRLTALQGLAVAAPAPAAGLTASPNPTTGLLQLSGVTDGRFVLRDATGRTVLAAPASPRLDLGSLPAGLYLLEHTSAAGRSQMRVVKD